MSGTRVWGFISNLLAGLARIYLIPLYLLSGLVPRDRNLWVFGSWGGYRFADNAASLFLFCEESNRPECVHVWISRRRSVVEMLRRSGHKAHFIWSPAGLYYCARAGVYLFDCFSKDVNYWLSRGALKVNLWSGVPVKKFERDIDNPNSRYFRLFHGSPVERLILRALMPWHVDDLALIIATSEKSRAIICGAFDVPAEKVVITGYPRTDVFMDCERSLSSAFGEFPDNVRRAVDSGKKLFVFLPTYRDDGSTYSQVDWERMNSFLGEQNALLLYRFHYVDTSETEREFENLPILPDDCDLYAILAVTDCLISDYSSVVFDYLLLRKPIIYYLPDHDRYVSRERKLNFDLDKIAVGPRCRTFGDLLEAMADVASRERVELEETEHFVRMREMMHAFTDARSRERVLSEVHRLIDAVSNND